MKNALSHCRAAGGVNMFGRSASERGYGCGLRRLNNIREGKLIVATPVCVVIYSKDSANKVAINMWVVKCLFFHKKMSNEILLFSTVLNYFWITSSLLLLCKILLMSFLLDIVLYSFLLLYNLEKYTYILFIEIGLLFNCLLTFFLKCTVLPGSPLVVWFI